MASWQSCGAPAARWCCAVGTAAWLVAASPARAAEIHVYSSGGPQMAEKAIAAELTKRSGHQVRFTIDAPGGIQQKLAAGEKADVVVLPKSGMDAVEKTGVLRAGSRVDIARLGLGVAVREGAASPDISTADAVRNLLLQAKSIAIPDPSLSPSGGLYMRALDQLGITDAVRPKITFRTSVAGGVKLVASGEIEIGLYQVGDILPYRGAKVVGLLPAPLQTWTIITAAVGADSAAAEAAAAFIAMLREPEADGAWTAAGLEPLHAAK